jgi:hypothetical protein
VIKVPCPLCESDPELVFYRGAGVLGLWDQFPGNDGQAILVTRRHARAWSEATGEERAELFSALASVHEAIGARSCEIEIHEAPHLHARLRPKPAPLADRVLDRAAPFGPTLVTGESDPLLPYLNRHLDEVEARAFRWV